MLVREYLETVSSNENVTFIKTVAQKDEHSPFYSEVYQTTPIRQAYEWQNSPIADFYILNHKQCPIDWISGAEWKNQYEKGHLKSLLVISEADLHLLYSPKQAAGMIEYIEGVIKNDL